ncbi:MAG TPA: FAD-dependent oxidoreductase [Candidatus Methylomirabilis sp.]|nr:FAD-dependent oxidoreductase [Candidatus Methylomirabilis sp.]
MNASRADVVVIGGGVRGCACAYHLAKAGVQVTLVEKANIASACSGATFALINASHKDPGFYAALSLESAKLFAGLEAELGEDLEYRPVGNITTLLEDAKGLPGLERFIRQQNQVPGLRLELLSGEEARRLEPALAPGLVAACFCAQDAHLNPYKLTVGYARAARRLGATILTQTKVTGLEIERSQVRAVVTDRGRLATGTVVVAAGIDMAQIGRMMGLTIPVVASRGQVITTERTRPVLNRPVGSLRQTADGTVLIGVTYQFVGRETRVTYEDVTRNAQHALRLFPPLQHLNVIRLWAGLRPYSVDGLPILGPASHIRGVFLATGHSGITLAQVTGKIITELVTTGRSAIPIDEFSLERFTSVRYKFVMDAFQRVQAGADQVA